MKKFLALIMAMLMVLTCASALSMGVFADEGESTDTPAEPDLSVQYEINFRKYDEDVSDVLAGNSNQIEVVKEAKSGYATFNATEGANDPYIVFAGYGDVSADKMIYAVIKYRTSADFQGEGYLQFVKEDVGQEAAGWGPATQYTPAFGGAGTWQVVKVDLTKLASIQESFRVQNIRLDLAPNVSFDLAYIKFFASVEGADAQIAAEQVVKNVKGEYNEGDVNVVLVGENAYASAETVVALTAKEGAEGVYVDADGAEYTLRGSYVINAAGQDTGLTFLTAADGKYYAYSGAAFYPLTYLDPEAASVEVNGTKYAYGAKADATANMIPVAPDTTPGAKPAAGTYADFPAHNSTDTIKLDTIPYIDGGANTALQGAVGTAKPDVGNNSIYDVDKARTSISFRGWLGHTEDAVSELGYVINDGTPVWLGAGSLEPTEDAVKAAGGGANSQRYNIDIPVAELAEGIYFVTLLVKCGENVYSINTAWGADIWFVKGGSRTVGYYAVGADKYTFDTNGALLKNGTAAPATDYLDTTGETAVLYTGLAELSADATGKYVYEADLSYVMAPAVPYNPAELTPDFLYDGPDMANGAMTGITAEYDYEGGFVTYTATAADPNAGSPFVGNVMPRYMVIKYRTDNAQADGFFVSCDAAKLGGASHVPVSWTVDGEWHTTVLDLTESDDYQEGVAVAHFRMDMIQDGSVIDIAYFAFFNDKLAADTYVEENIYVAPKYHTATFVNEAGETVKEILFKEGDTAIFEPAVPEKEGFDGAWSEYTLGTEDITITPVYTEKQTEAPTDPTDDPTDAPTDPADDPTDAPTDPSGDPTDAPTADPNAGTDDTNTDKGCASAIGLGVIAMIATAVAATVVLKKKED